MYNCFLPFSFAVTTLLTVPLDFLTINSIINLNVSGSFKSSELTPAFSIISLYASGNESSIMLLAPKCPVCLKLVGLPILSLSSSFDFVNLLKKLVLRSIELLLDLFEDLS
eukprot:NODE_363_length_10100_cov_0.133787.p8 type:complete len:111 gc:universal NODE_363_length_10100_cov_0.133787:6924-6592(-)